MGEEGRVAQICDDAGALFKNVMSHNVNVQKLENSKAQTTKKNNKKIDIHMAFELNTFVL